MNDSPLQLNDSLVRSIGLDLDLPLVIETINTPHGAGTTTLPVGWKIIANVVAGTKDESVVVINTAHIVAFYQYPDRS